MILSTRVNPPKALNLTRPPSQKNLSFRHLLLHSPLPSPSLPSILPRHGKKPQKLNSRKIVRLLCWTASVICIYTCFTTLRRHDDLLNSSEYLSSDGKIYEIVGNNELPQFASPMALTDSHGQSKWTISIPSSLGFPLASSYYSDICSQSEDVARHVAELKGRLRSSAREYYYHEPDYIDVPDAQASGLLPQDLAHTVLSSDEVCSRSLTYVLDATDAGLGSTLLGLWLAYSLAKHESRAFFIDDTLFAYGDYGSYFVPPAMPSCRPPPPTQMVPCPHHARHLVVSAATRKWAFGAAFSKRFGRKEVFDMMREGYKALFQLSNDDDADYVRERIVKLRRESDLLVGIHVRRGDRHPLEFQYSGSYIPLGKYMAAAEEFVNKPEVRVKMILASDDPDVYDNSEMSGTVRAQDHISLASKTTLAEGALGWEGGFFRNVFWGLGLPEGVQEQKHAGSPGPTRRKIGDQKLAHVGDTDRDYRTHPTEEALLLRGLIGRSYLLDLAVLGQSDLVVCAVSSSACRILAVVMGWENAIEEGKWKNVDGGDGREADWRGLEWW